VRPPVFVEASAEDHDLALSALAVLLAPLFPVTDDPAGVRAEAEAGAVAETAKGRPPAS
jgi:hypothetical protein